jgi:hypothetical protein
MIQVITDVGEGAQSLDVISHLRAKQVESQPTGIRKEI